MPIYIFWSGYGFLAPLIALFWMGVMIGIEHILGGVISMDHEWMESVMALSWILYTGLSCYAVGHYLKDHKTLDFVDNVTGVKHYKQGKKHSFMGLNLQTWGKLLLAWALFGIGSEIAQVLIQW